MKKYFEFGTFKNFIKRGFSLIGGKTFVIGAIIKIVGLFLLFLLPMLIMGIDPLLMINPMALISSMGYLGIGSIKIIVAIIIMIAGILVFLMAEGMLTHILANEAVSESGGMKSLKFTFSNFGNWLLLFLFALGVIIVLGLLFFIFGYMGIVGRILSIIVLVALLIISPILNLVIPIMVLEGRNVISALVRAIKIGYEHYGRLFAVLAFNGAISLIFITIFLPISNATIMALTMSLLGRENTPEFSFDKYSTIIKEGRISSFKDFNDVKNELSSTIEKERSELNKKDGPES